MAGDDRIRVAFFGTPDVAVPSLAALDDAVDVDVVAAVTNPDRPRGRSRIPVPPPVKVAAQERGITVLQPHRPRDILDRLHSLSLDAVAVVAYGAILPADVLEAPRHGYVNLHFSLLPRWRGAAPVQHAIRAGDHTTGITTFVIDVGMDTGPILQQVEVDIAPDETAGELLERLAVIGAPVLVDSIRQLLQGVEPQSQRDDGVTYAARITPEDVRIDWSMPARSVVDLVRSANPAPGAHTTFRGQRLKIWRAEQAQGGGQPGTVLGADPRGPVVATGDQAVVLTEVQPAGKVAMPGGAFTNGYRPEPGERLGDDR
ncbi:MAG: methionyl-tRNA formyltransferase [Actinomycetota bacterium]|nr:methionyl-tRNA formyltransferase [Actinomycetota bacterium]